MDYMKRPSLMLKLVTNILEIGLPHLCVMRQLYVLLRKTESVRSSFPSESVM